MTKIKYSPLTTGNGYESTGQKSFCSLSNILGVLSCILIAGCVVLSILIAKILAENKFLQSPYTNYTSSYSFGIISDIELDLNSSTCCSFETNHSCLCCPNNQKLLNATFNSLVKILKMYVNTKFILYLGNIASTPEKSEETLAHFSAFVKDSSVNIPLYPTLGLKDRPIGSPQNFYNSLYKSWIQLISCFNCPLSSNVEGVKDTIIAGGYYSISTNYGVKIISINTNLFLENTSPTERIAAENQLQWLESVLVSSSSSQQNEKATSKILVGGCAPGYSTKDISLVKKNERDKVIEGEWDADFLYRFTALISKHRFRWSGIFMGGVEFELVRRLDKRYIFLTPPCSPLHCSYPVFRVAFLSERDKALQDLHQYYSPIDLFTGVGESPKYMFDFSYERVIFGSEQPRGPVFLNYYNINQFYESLVNSFDLQKWKTLSYTKKVDKNDGFSSPYLTYCTTQFSNTSKQLDCLKRFKF